MNTRIRTKRRETKGCNGQPPCRCILVDQDRYISTLIPATFRTTPTNLTNPRRPPNRNPLDPTSLLPSSAGKRRPQSLNPPPAQSPKEVIHLRLHPFRRLHLACRRLRGPYYLPLMYQKQTPQYPHSTSQILGSHYPRPSCQYRS